MTTKTTRRGAPIVFPQASTTGGITPDHLDDLIAHHTAGRKQQAAESFVKLIQAIADDARPGHDEPTRREFAGKVLTALSVFCSERFTIPETMAFRMLRCCPVISNVLASVGTKTDVHLRLVGGQKQGAFKSAVLYSPRNLTEIEIGPLLESNAGLVSAWVNQAAKVLYQGNADARVHAHAVRILRQLDDRLIATLDVHEPYFLVSYLGDLDTERHVKGLINRAIQASVTTEVRNRPDPRKIAVFSEYWNTGHSVHRTLAGYIKALRPHFDEITLIHAVKETKELDTAGFDRVIRLKADGLTIDAAPLQDNPWSVVIFPDIGMTLPSVVMANLRIAPVQVMLTGHPASTFGGRIDWFVTGAATDTDPDNYSERLAILPGFGCVHQPIETTPKPGPRSGDEIVIGVSAYGQKIHHEWLNALGRAIKSAGRKVRVRLFTGAASMNYKGLAVFADTVGEALAPAHVELVAHLPYEQYLSKMAECDFAVDCWPFGGSNTVSDWIHCRVPVIPVPECHAGRWFAAIGGAMLETFDKTIFITEDEWIGQVAGLIEASSLRSLNRDFMAAADTGKVYDQSDAAVFARFIVNVARNPDHYPPGANVALEATP
jgi:hypothetical protein